MAIGDLELAPQMDQLYFPDRIVGTARRSWRKLPPVARTVDILEIQTGVRSPYELLSSAVAADVEYLRWRVYRACDIAEDLGIHKIVLSLPGRRMAPSGRGEPSAALRSLLREIVGYDTQRTFVLAIGESFQESGFRPETENDLMHLVRAGRLEVRRTSS
ncbi:MAG TPA: hypothetical protein VFH83_15210 [Spirochaetia bacterium]|nr:hypothetical protein [Spirochaetia bacterium]